MSGWATSSWPLRSPTSGTSRASRAGWATCSTWRPKDLEKVIYFAAYMITWVDDEARAPRPAVARGARSPSSGSRSRSAATPTSRPGQRSSRPTWPSSRPRAPRATSRRKVREGAEREMRQIRDRAQREIDRLDEVWNRFKNLKVQDLEGDELLYREMRDRFGQYFRGGMGAAGASRSASSSFDLEAEGRDAARDHPHRQGPEEDPRAQAAQGRLGVPQHPQLARWAWCSTASR